MSKTIVNLTISVVEAAAATVLSGYPYYPYQQTFSAPLMRQKLVAYVLSRFPGLYALLEEQEASDEALHCSPELRQQIDPFIHRGVQYLLSSCLSQARSEPADYGSIERDEDMEGMNVGMTSSHWFK